MTWGVANQERKGRVLLSNDSKLGLSCVIGSRLLLKGGFPFRFEYSWLKDGSSGMLS